MGGFFFWWNTAPIVHAPYSKWMPFLLVQKQTVQIGQKAACRCGSPRQVPALNYAINVPGCQLKSYRGGCSAKLGVCFSQHFIFSAQPTKSAIYVWHWGAVCLFSHRALVLNLCSQESLHIKIPTLEKIQSLACTTDGTFVIAGTESGRITVWQVMAAFFIFFYWLSELLVCCGCAPV